MSGWLDFWNRPNRIYVNETHLRLHYRHIAEELAALAPRGGGVLLDYGCGDALDAARVAAGVDRLLLYDAAAAVRERLRVRHGGEPRIVVLDDAALAAIEPGSVDLVMVCSVAQYLTRAEFEALLGRVRDWVAPDGRLVLADVVPPGPGMVADVAALLRTAWRGGFVLAAVGGLAATLVSDYARNRRTLQLAAYTQAEIGALAAAAGFEARREPRNLGFNRRRMTFTLRPVRPA